MKIDPIERVRKLRRANPKRKPDKIQDRIPPGQYLTDKFPVLTYGTTPDVYPKDWRFRVFGLVDEELEFNYDEFMSMPQIRLTADFHCVTRWSQLDNEWEGTSFPELMKQLSVKPQAKFVMLHSYGGYTTNVPVEALLDDDVLFAHSRNGQPLSREHGWPLRLIVPKLYGWKSAKWVNGLEFMEKDKPGFWEMYGYHNNGDPWEEERFSG